MKHALYEVRTVVTLLVFANNANKKRTERSKLLFDMLKFFL